MSIFATSITCFGFSRWTRRKARNPGNLLVFLKEPARNWTKLNKYLMSLKGTRRKYGQGLTTEIRGLNPEIRGDGPEILCRNFMDRVTFWARWLRHRNRFKNENDYHLVPISCQLQNWLFIFPPSLCQWVFLLFDKSDKVWGNQKRKNALRASSSVHFQIGHKECANFNPMVIVNGWFCCSIKFSDIKNVKACRPLPLASCLCLCQFQTCPKDHARNA